MGAKLLLPHGWNVIDPKSFARETSYGFDENQERFLDETEDYKDALRKCSAVIEFRGTDCGESEYFPGTPRFPTIIDDLLIFLSLYSGVFSQYLAYETEISLTFAAQITRAGNANWAASRGDVALHFHNSLLQITSLDRTQFELAVKGFLSAIKEYETGRPLVEAGFNWTCLESQANHLGISGTNRPMVETLLKNQGFPPIPELRAFYRLRNDATHGGQLASLSEPDAQKARTAGRQVVRAQVLNLLGMQHSDFSTDLTRDYI